MGLAPFTIILRGYDTESAVLIAKKLEEYKCFNVEVTLNTSSSLEIIDALNKLNLKNVKVGAGTVLNLKQLQEAAKYGIKFALSPIMMTNEMIDFCKRSSITSVPGALTPSEIYQMMLYGADIIKVFPASTLDFGYYKAIQAPLGNLDIMAVGGVTVSNASDFLRAGCKYIGIGSSLCKVKDIQSGNFKELENNISKLNKLFIELGGKNDKESD